MGGSEFGEVGGRTGGSRRLSPPQPNQAAADNAGLHVRKGNSGCLLFRPQLKRTWVTGGGAFLCVMYVVGWSRVLTMCAMEISSSSGGGGGHSTVLPTTAQLRRRNVVVSAHNGGTGSVGGVIRRETGTRSDPDPSMSPWTELWNSMTSSTDDSRPPGERRPRHRTMSHAYVGRGRAAEVARDDVTMATHASARKLSELLLQIGLWGGPVSAALYLTSLDDAMAFAKFTSENAEPLQNTTIHVYMEEVNDPSSLSSAKPRSEYPHNILRNLATHNVESDFFLTMDVDFVTSRGCHERLRRALNGPNSTIRTALRSKTLFVLPAFERFAPSELEHTNDNRTVVTVDMLPGTKADILEMRDNKTVAPFHLKQWRYGHGPTNFPEWYRDATKEEGEEEQRQFYPIEYKSHFFEPYVLAYRHGVPRYWTEFRGFCYNKFTWIMEMHYMGYKFATLRDHFVVHVNHPHYGTGKGGRSYSCSEENKRALVAFKEHMMDLHGAPKSTLALVF